MNLINSLQSLGAMDILTYASFGACVLLSVNQFNLMRKLNALQEQARGFHRQIASGLTDVADATNHVGGRMERFESEVHNIHVRQEALTQRVPELAALAKAEKLVRKGASADDLVSKGLGRAEAELLTQLHTKDVG